MWLVAHRAREWRWDFLEQHTSNNFFASDWQGRRTYEMQVSLNLAG